MPRSQGVAPQTTMFVGSPEPSLMTYGEPSLFGAPVWIPVDLYAYQGDDSRWIFRLKATNGDPFPLTGYSAALQFRVAVADTDTSSGVTPTAIVTDAPGGEILVTLSSDQSRTMRQISYVWDLEITHIANSWTTTVAAGTLTMTKEITRVP